LQFLGTKGKGRNNGVGGNLTALNAPSGSKTPKKSCKEAKASRSTEEEGGLEHGTRTPLWKRGLGVGPKLSFFKKPKNRDLTRKKGK